LASPLVEEMPTPVTTMTAFPVRRRGGGEAGDHELPVQQLGELMHRRR
jgi:hypothetical protein